jgi:hypothetical protein
MTTIKDDIIALEESADAIIKYYKTYGFLKWEAMSPERFLNAPTKNVINLSDYIGTLNDILNAADDGEVFNALSQETINHLKKCESEMERILIQHTNIEEVILSLEELLDTHKRDIDEAITDDYFFYELACHSRNSIEAYIRILKALYGKEGLVVKGIKFEVILETLDNRLKMLLERCKNDPNLQKPFLKCPCYTPKTYWWYRDQ